MTGVAEQPDELRVALGEVGALATLATAAYDSADWGEPDPVVVDGIASLLRRISKLATAAMTALYRRHGAVADAQPAPAGEARPACGAPWRQAFADSAGALRCAPRSWSSCTWPTCARRPPSGRRRIERALSSR